MMTIETNARKLSENRKFVRLSHQGIYYYLNSTIEEEDSIAMYGS